LIVSWNGNDGREKKRKSTDGGGYTVSKSNSPYITPFKQPESISVAIFGTFEIRLNQSPQRAFVSNYGLCMLLYPGPYTLTQRSSNALTINVDTLPKNAPDTAACKGFANSYARSSERIVGPVSSTVALPGEVAAPAAAGWKRHVVSSVLKSGVDDAATACTSNKKNKNTMNSLTKEKSLFNCMLGGTYPDGLVGHTRHAARVALREPEEGDGQFSLHLQCDAAL
jgi:hypothetical protein